MSVHSVSTAAKITPSSFIFSAWTTRLPSLARQPSSDVNASKPTLDANKRRKHWNCSAAAVGFVSNVG